ncbi:hypothetical protein GX51_02010 [Blastomyces parvus]|uniref:Uncharacterized protein n=1 Tax=Blastomyces parvus TaxID=2060905 RepID=A0A2B7XE12_9EURO|nr:hypothetical protein GX51_02010 [Blastomyces parvus]
MTAGQTVTTSNITECGRKPAGKSPSECPVYKEVQAASSRKKEYTNANLAGKWVRRPSTIFQCSRTRAECKVWGYDIE